MNEPIKFMVYREAHIERLGVALFIKKTPTGYEVGNPRDELGLIGSGITVKHISNNQFIALVDRRKAIAIFSIMKLLGGQYRAVKTAARKAMVDAVDKVANSLKSRGEMNDEDSEVGSQ